MGLTLSYKASELDWEFLKFRDPYSGLKKETWIVHWASSSHIFLAMGYFLLIYVSDFVRGWPAQTIVHWANDLLTRSRKTNYERTTGELTIWLTIDDCLTVTIACHGLTEWRPITSWRNWPIRSISEYNTINWRDTTHFDSEDDYPTGCRNVSHCQQQYSPTQPTFEMNPWFKPFTVKTFWWYFWLKFWYWLFLFSEKSLKQKLFPTKSCSKFSFKIVLEFQEQIALR